MTTGTGLSAQLGLATETSYGTYVAPNRFLPFEASGESIAEQVEHVIADILGGQTPWRQASHVRAWSKGAQGDIPFVALTRGFGIVLKHALGQVTTSQPDPTNKPNEYRHVFSPDTSGKRGLSATVQIGRPRRDDAVVVPYTYLGGKITAFELSCAQGEPVKFNTTWDFKRVDMSKTLASPTWPSGVPLTFADASVTVNGNTFKVTEFTVSFDWSLDVESFVLGGDKAEPVFSDRPTIEGSFSTWYMSGIDPLLDAWRAGNEVGPIVFTAQYGEIDAGKSNPYKLIVEIPTAKLTGQPPQVGGPGPIEMSIEFVALATGTFAPLTITYHTSDSTP